TAAELADAALGPLTPAWMVDVGVDVGVEPVLVRSHDVPGGGRLFRHEGDADYRLDAFETVLPGNDEPDGGTVGVVEGLVVQPSSQYHQRVHGLVERQTLYVRERQQTAPLTDLLLGPQHAGEGNVARFW